MKPVFYVASSLLVLVQSVTLGLLIWVTVRRKPAVSPRQLLAGGSRNALVTYSFGTRKPPRREGGRGYWFTDSYPTGSQVGGWQVVHTPLMRPVPGVAAAARTAAYVKWSFAPQYFRKNYELLTLVAPGRSFRYRVPTWREAGVYVLGTPHKRKESAGWWKYRNENVHPAWWGRLLRVDTSVLVLDPRASSANTNSATLLRVMDTFGLSEDDAFSATFSPLTSAIALLSG
jgi:hypothetical protein